MRLEPDEEAVIVAELRVQRLMGNWIIPGLLLWRVVVLVDDFTGPGEINLLFVLLDAALVALWVAVLRTAWAGVAKLREELREGTA